MQKRWGQAILVLCIFLMEVCRDNENDFKGQAAKKNTESSKPAEELENTPIHDLEWVEKEEIAPMVAELREMQETAGAALYADYDGEGIQVLVFQEAFQESPARRSDIVFYEEKEGESLQAAVKKMIEAMLEPLKQPEEGRSYTITEYVVEEQELVLVQENLWLLPKLNVYYCYDGNDVISMETYREAEPELEKDGRMPLMREGSENTFVYVLMKKDGVYRLQRAEEMLK